MSTATQVENAQSKAGGFRARKNLVIPLALVLLAAGVLANAALLQRTVLPEGIIQAGSRRALALGFCRLFMIGFGAFLLWRRPRITSIHLCAFGLMGAVSAVVALLALQVLHKPRP